MYRIAAHWCPWPSTSPQAARCPPPCLALLLPLPPSPPGRRSWYGAIAQGIDICFSNPGAQAVEGGGSRLLLRRIPPPLPLDRKSAPAEGGLQLGLVYTLRYNAVSNRATQQGLLEIYLRHLQTSLPASSPPPPTCPPAHTLTPLLPPGTSERHFVSELDSVPSLRPVLGLHETVCTGAADGVGRMARRPALALLHLGPGLANGLANLHNARRAGTPLLAVVVEFGGAGGSCRSCWGWVAALGLPGAGLHLGSRSLKMCRCCLVLDARSVPIRLPYFPHARAARARDGRGGLGAGGREQGVCLLLLREEPPSAELGGPRQQTAGRTWHLLALSSMYSLNAS